MTGKPSRRNLSGNYSHTSSRAKKIGNRHRSPFWLPASNFYVLAAAIAITVFFVVWGILHDGGETPWIPAGVLASLVLVGAVILREIVLRKRRNNLLLAQERLDQNLKSAYRHKPVYQAPENKLTLDQNAEILRHIAKKSEAAKVLGKLSEAHWEVFELCDEYLNRSEKELQRINPASPRLAAIKGGREKIRDLHKFHLLAWSSAESKELMQEAKASVTISKKLELAGKAKNILDSAIQFYPQDSVLLESSSAVAEFIATIKVTHWIEQAERFAFKGKHKRAINSYRDALFYLARENVRSEEREAIAKRINFEIEQLVKISGEEESEINAGRKKGKILDKG